MFNKKIWEAIERLTASVERLIETVIDLDKRVKELEQPKYKYFGGGK